MQFQWIIVGIVLISSSSSSSSSSSNTSTPATVADPDNRDIKRLWAAALQAINAAELQRRNRNQNRPQTQQQHTQFAATVGAESQTATATAQRLNSKRLRWRQNSKVLDRRAEAELAALEAAFGVEPRSGTYPSSEEADINPTYIDVRDHEPAPAPWWF